MTSTILDAVAEIAELVGQVNAVSVLNEYWTGMELNKRVKSGIVCIRGEKKHTCHSLLPKGGRVSSKACDYGFWRPGRREVDFGVVKNPSFDRSTRSFG